MDVLAQVRDVVDRVGAASGHVTLTLDLRHPAHRAAYAAAVAVLQISGVDPDVLARSEGTEAASDAGDSAGPGERAADTRPRDSGAPGPSDSFEGPTATDGSDEYDGHLRRSYADALAELTPDAARQQAVLQATFPHIRELLRDGANVEAVAQIQYRRWVEEHLDALRQ
jgi:hypothetical protein